MNLGKEILQICIAWGTLAVPVVLVCAILGFGFWIGRRRILPRRRQLSAPWSAVEVFLVFALWMLLPQLFAWNLVQSFGETAEMHKALIESMGPVLAFPFFLTGVCLFLRIGSGTRLYHLGLHYYQWTRSVFLGGLSWLAATLLIFLFYAIVVWYVTWVGNAPDKHDLARMIQSENSLLAWAVLLVSVLVVAPSVEEILFRGVMQRWAAKEVLRSHMLFAAATVLAVLLHGEDLEPAAVLFFAVVFGVYLLAPVVVRRQVGVHRNPGKGAPDAPDTRPIFDLYDDFISPAMGEKLTKYVPYLDLTGRKKKVRRLRSIIAASLLFAVLHPWPSPLPLFLLGLVLGWLAQRTQSLVGPIFLHMLFNGVTCLQLALFL